MSLETEIIKYLRQEGIDAASPVGKSLFNVCFGFTTAWRRKTSDRFTATMREKYADVYLEIMRLRRKGLSHREISLKIHLSQGLVRNTIIRLGGADIKNKKQIETTKIHKEIMRLGDAGVSMSVICKKVRRSKSTVGNVLIKHRGPLFKTTTSAERANIKKLYNQGRTTREIADETGWTIYTVRNHIDKKGAA